VKPDDKIEMIDTKLQSRLSSGVGMLLFLSQSRMGLVPFVHELSKWFYGASTAVYKEMVRVAEFFESQITFL
jgi:hypothetical protein